MIPEDETEFVGIPAECRYPPWKRIVLDEEVHFAPEFLSKWVGVPVPSVVTEPLTFADLQAMAAKYRPVPDYGGGLLASRRTFHRWQRVYAVRRIALRVEAEARARREEPAALDAALALCAVIGARDPFDRKNSSAYRGLIAAQLQRLRRRERDTVTAILRRALWYQEPGGGRPPIRMLGPA